MRVRALILDLYGTLLNTVPAKLDLHADWSRFWRDRLHRPPRLSPEQFATECDRAVAREHALAQARGIGWPEVYWPDVVCAVLPEAADWPEPELSDLRFFHPRWSLEVGLMEGAAPTLALLADSHVLLGLASNCQPYTLRELDSLFSSAGLSRNMFQPGLCFFSFEHGFSKPNPHVFQMLSARLAARGVRPAETMMVGDRMDSDIEPARAVGWQTWHLNGAAASNWAAFRQWWRRSGPHGHHGGGRTKKIRRSLTRSHP